MEGVVYNENMKKEYIWIVLIIALLLGAGAWLSQTKTRSGQEEVAEKESVSILLVGDIMLDRGVEYMVEKYGGGDFNFPFLKIADTLKEADITFGNLEGPISDKGEKVGSIYSFRAEPEAVEGLASAGFDVLSLANNHAFDYGFEALEDTIIRIKDAGMEYVGIGPALIRKVKGSTGSPLRVAFLAYTNLGSPYWGLNWADWNNLEDIKKEVEETKAKADVVIVSLHAGEEYTEKPNDFQKEFAKAVIDSGADIVVGHHPHVIQPNEKYPSINSGQAGYIFYSLGNFVFDQGFSEETMKGQMVKVLIEDKKIKEVVPINIKINKYFQPEISN